MRIDCLKHPLLVDLLRQRQLHQDAVDRRIAVEPVDQRQKFVGGGLGRRAMELADDAGLFAGLLLVPHIDLAGRIFADQNGGQARRHAGGADERGHILGDFRPNLLGQGLSIEDRSSHGSSSERKELLAAQRERRRLKSEIDGCASARACRCAAAGYEAAWPVGSTT